MDDVREFMGIAFNRYWVVVGAIALATIVAIYYGWHLARKSKSEEEKPS